MVPISTRTPARGAPRDRAHGSWHAARATARALVGLLSFALAFAAPVAAQPAPLAPLPTHTDTPSTGPRPVNIANRVGRGARGKAALAATLEAIVAGPAFRRSRVGVEVVRLDTGEQLFARGEGRLLVPASNVKLVTTLAALDALSPDFQFPTEVFGALDANGTVAGDLVIKGYGDPYLVPERVTFLATRLKMQGVVRIDGDLVIDDTFFDANDRMARGFREDRSSRAYMAPAGAVSVGFNAVMVHVLPSLLPGADARVLIEPEQAYLRGVDGSVATVDGVTSRAQVDVTGRRVRVAGFVERALGPHAFWRRIEDPPLFAGEVFKSALHSAGIVFDGQVRTGALPGNAAPLAAFDSPRLGDLIVPLNKFSNNFMASQLALTLGAYRYGAPATWHKAHDALRRFMSERVGIAPDAYTINNASGLHNVNAMTAEQLVKLLVFARRQPRYAIEFENALPTASGVGTLAERMHDSKASFVVRAKTGTLSTASSLSGYAETADGVPLAFSLLCNHYRHIEDVWAAQDLFAATLATARLRGACAPAAKAAHAP